MALQFSLIIGRSWRGLPSCNARAINSLPVPVSPWINTVVSVGATTATWCSAARKVGLRADDFAEVGGFRNLLLEIPIFLLKLALQSLHLTQGCSELRGARGDAGFQLAIGLLGVSPRACVGRGGYARAPAPLRTGRVW